MSPTPSVSKATPSGLSGTDSFDKGQAQPRGGRFRLSSPAFFRRFVTLMLASVLILFLAGSALAAIDAPRPIVSGTYTDGEWDPSQLPDVALLVSGAEAGDPTIERMVIPALRDLPGVAGVTAELTQTGRVAIYVSMQADADQDLVATIHSLVTRSLPDSRVALGGRLVADQDLLDRLNRGTIVAVVPVVILLTVLVSVAFGLRFGAAAGGTVGLSTLLGGLVGNRVAGSFDGTLATTAVPAVLVAILVSTVLTLRLLEWFKSPRGDDQADAIKNSVAHLVPETALLFGGLVATALLLELMGPGRATASVVAVGGLIATVITLGTMPALLSTLGAVPVKDGGPVSSEIPDGRDFPIAVLGGFACFLLGLGLLAVRVPTGDLLDESDFASGVSSRRVSEQLVELGGDPTSAILARIPAAASEQQIASWATSVSELSTVGWVQTNVGRFVAGTRVGASDKELYLQDESVLAIVTPTVTPRSKAARSLVAGLEASSETLQGGLTAISPNLLPGIELSGAPIDAAVIAERSKSQLLILIALLAISGGLAVLVLVGDLFMAIATVALRLLGLGAVLGIYRLVAGDVGSSELQVATLVLGVGIGLFEIGFVRRVSLDLAKARANPTIDVVDLNEDAAKVEAESSRSELVTKALHHEGRAAMFGLGITALCGLGFIVGDLDVTRRLGVAVAAGVVVELMVGTWLLRPVVLGQRIIMISPARVEHQDIRQIGENGQVTHSDGSRGKKVRFPSFVTLPSFSSVSQVLPDLRAKALSWRPYTRPVNLDEALALGHQGGSIQTASAAATTSGFRAHVSGEQQDWREMPPVGHPLSDSFADAEDIAPERQSSVPENQNIVPEDQNIAPEWRRIVGGLLRSEFSFQSEPETAELETVFVTGTPLFTELESHNRSLRKAGLKVEGEGPKLRKVRAVNVGSPVTLAVTVDHPERRLYNFNGQLIGTRRAERRHGMLWLVQDPSGRYRIAEAVDLGEHDSTSASKAASALSAMSPAVLPVTS